MDAEIKKQIIAGVAVVAIAGAGAYLYTKYVQVSGGQSKATTMTPSIETAITPVASVPSTTTTSSAGSSSVKTVDSTTVVTSNVPPSTTPVTVTTVIPVVTTPVVTASVPTTTTTTNSGTTTTISTVVPAASTSTTVVTNLPVTTTPVTTITASVATPPVSTAPVIDPVVTVSSSVNDAYVNNVYNTANGTGFTPGGQVNIGGFSPYAPYAFTAVYGATADANGNWSYGMGSTGDEWAALDVASGKYSNTFGA